MADIPPQPETIAGDIFDARMAESIQRNFETLYLLLAGNQALSVGTPGDILVAGSDGRFASLAKPASGSKYLGGISGASPAYVLVDLANGVQGLLPVTALNVTGTPAAGVILYGDRWAAPPTGGALASSNYGAYIPRPDSGSIFLGIGVRAPTIVGAAFTADHKSDSTYARHTSGAVSGNVAGFDGTDYICQAQHDPTVDMIVQTYDALTSIRLWLGLTSGANMVDADDQGGAVHCAAFRFSTVAGDTSWLGVTRDGTTQSVSAAIGSIAVSTRYALKIRVVSGDGVYFSTDGGVTETKVSANLPGATTTLRMSCRVITQTGAARSFLFSRGLVVYGT